MVSSFFTMRHRSGRILTSHLASASSSSCGSFQYSNSLSFRNEPQGGTARSCADKLRCMTSILGECGGAYGGEFKEFHGRRLWAVPSPLKQNSGSSFWWFMF